jgi:hypothetical protein
MTFPNCDRSYRLELSGGVSIEFSIILYHLLIFRLCHRAPGCQKIVLKKPRARYFLITRTTSDGALSVPFESTART